MMTDFISCHLEASPNFIGNNEVMTEIASGVFVPQNPSQGRGSEFKGEGAQPSPSPETTKASSLRADP